MQVRVKYPYLTNKIISLCFVDYQEILEVYNVSRHNHKLLINVMILGLYCYGTIVRDTATWSKVKQNSDGLKHRCEMFDATASGYCNATEVQDTGTARTHVSPRIFHMGLEETETATEPTLETCQIMESVQVILLSNLQVVPEICTHIVKIS